jgi:hypothetical protein
MAAFTKYDFAGLYLGPNMEIWVRVLSFANTAEAL